jgi:bifunctional DNA-binding transcriptional regulator/antitoxin component of YhaV-PrlF toxin-antitoxin module
VSKFLFQLDPIDGYEFNPIPIDIHLGIIKIPKKEFLDDFGINTTKSIIVDTDRNEVLNRLQPAFSREFERYGKLKESDIRPMDYKTKQVWTGIRRHIKSKPI